MNAYLDNLVAQSVAREREHQLQQALRHRRDSAGRHRPSRHLAVPRPLRARLASIVAMSH